MPRAFDRRTPQNDKDPLANLLDFENWQKSIDETADLAGQAIRDFTQNAADAAAALAVELANVAQALGDAINQFLVNIGLDPAIFEDPDFDPIEFLLTWVENFLLPTGLIGDAKWSDLYATLTGEPGGDLMKVTNFLITQLFGPVFANRLPFVPASHIGEASPNLLAGYTFENADVISDGEDVWTWDGDVGHTGPGSVTVIAAGVSRELLGIDIAVSEGHAFDLGGWVKWVGLTGTGTPIQLAITAYHDDGATEQAVIASHNTIPPTTDWLHLTGTYTVPANVVSLRVRLVVMATATAGQVWWDDISASKHQPLIQRLIAGTDAGTRLPQDIQNLFTGIISNTMEIIQKVKQGDFDGLVQTIEGNIQEDFATIGARLNAFLHGDSPLNANNINSGQIGDGFVPGLSTIKDALVTAVGALSGSGFDIGKVFEVLTGQRYSVVGTSSQLVGLHSRISTAESKLAALPISLGGTGVGISFGGIVGASDTDEFERVDNNSLGTQWDQYYSSGGGKWAIPGGHDAEYMWSGTSDREFVCVRKNPSLLRSLTDYQRVTNVLSAKGTRHYDSVLGTYNYVGHNDVWLRVSDSTTSLANITGIRVRWGADGSISIVRFLAGAATTLKSYPTGTYTPPGPGAILIGEAGDMNGGTPGQRYFRGISGNNILIEITEVGVASGFGAAFRRWGHGGRVEGWSGLFDNGQERPGTLNYWNGMDQVFP